MLTGEADITTRDALRAALAALAADGTGGIYLELTELRFIDVSCTRELIALTGRHPAIRLIAHGPPACLLRITALICPQAKITFIAGARPGTGTAGRPGPDADLACDGCGSDRDGARRTSRLRRGGVTMTDAVGPITGDYTRSRRLPAAPGEFAHHSEDTTAGPPPGRSCRGQRADVHAAR